jgi:hypothetical protein
LTLEDIDEGHGRLRLIGPDKAGRKVSDHNPAMIEPDVALSSKSVVRE